MRKLALNILKIAFLFVFMLIYSNLCMAQVICPKCVKEGKESRVYPGGCTSTAMAGQAYYDEHGGYHYDDPNIVTCEYSCSNMHRFSTGSRNGQVLITTIEEDMPAPTYGTLGGEALVISSGSLAFSTPSTITPVKAFQDDIWHTLASADDLEVLKLKVEAMNTIILALMDRLDTLEKEKAQAGMVHILRDLGGSCGASTWSAGDIIGDLPPQPFSVLPLGTRNHILRSYVLGDPNPDWQPAWQPVDLRRKVKIPLPDEKCLRPK